MHLRIIAVVLLAALAAAGLGYGLLNMRGGGEGTPSTQMPMEVASTTNSLPPPVPQVPVAAPVPTLQSAPAPGMVPPVMPQGGVPPIIGPGALPLGQGGLPSVVPAGAMGVPGSSPSMQPIFAEDMPPVPPDVMMTMNAAFKQAYLEKIGKLEEPQLLMLREYTMEAVALENLYGIIAQRVMTQSQPVYAPAPGMMQNMPPQSRVVTSEDKIKELDMIRAQIEKVEAARKKFINTFGKAQKDVLKDYLKANAI